MWLARSVGCWLARSLSGAPVAAAVVDRERLDVDPAPIAPAMDFADLSYLRHKATHTEAGMSIRIEDKSVLRTLLTARGVRVHAV